MINVLDYETYRDHDNNVTPYCICFILDSKIYSLYNKEKIFIEALNIIVNVSKKNEIEFFIHNLSFDGRLILYELSKNKIRHKIFCVKSDIYSITIKYCEKRVIFKCSYKILDESLEKLGILENHNKLPFPYDFINKKTIYYKGSIPEKKFWKNEEDFKIFSIKHKYFDTEEYTIKYCINDVILTKKVLKNLFKIIDEQDKKIKEKSLSAPSIAFKLFFKKFNNKNISQNIPLEIEAYVRQSFMGGRCEVAGNLKNNEVIKYFDFSGMYGQCMLEKFHNGEYRFSLEKDVSKPGFYTIKYKSESEFLPVLPSIEDSKLMFTNGIKTGTFWFEEILLFLKEGGEILSIENALIYEKFENVFIEYVNEFTKIREKGGYYKKFGKLMINSLYGGMALNDSKTHIYLTFSEEEYQNIMKNLNVEDSFIINGMFIIIITVDFKLKMYVGDLGFKKYDRGGRNVSYASAISSKGRIKLFSAIKEVIKDGGRVLYYDTDSIFAAYPLNRKDHNLSFKWINEYKDGVFVAPKIYGLVDDKEDIKIKGVSNKDITFYELKDGFYSDQIVSFNNELIFNKKNFMLKQDIISKKIYLGGYDKRMFIDNKKSTKPLMTKAPCLYDIY